MNVTKKLLGTALAVLPCALFADRTVTTSAELVQALTDLKGTGETIILDGSSFDVSAYEMRNDNNAMAHLFLTGVTVRGKTDNPRDTVLYGNRTKSIVHMYPYVDAQGKLVDTVLQNLTVSNGCAKAGTLGGGVAGGQGGYFPICRNLVVTCNDNSSGNGGGLGYVTCYDCEVCGNTASVGGGVAYTKFHNGSIHGNSAINYGGGGFNNPEMIGCSVWGNTAGGYGGLACTGTYSAFDCNIVSNTATSAANGFHNGGAGGLFGPYFSGNTYVFSNCTFYANRSAGNNGAGSMMTLRDCVLHSNVAAGSAGAVQDSTLYDCVISNNVAVGNGGGASKCVLTDTVVVGNAITNAVPNGTACGGGVAECEATRCLIANNYSFNCGGGAGKSTLVDCVVSNNFASTQGGGMYQGSARDSQILFNVVSNDYADTASGYWAQGAGVRLATLTTCVLAGNAIADCTSSQKLGGAASDSSLTDCQVFNNYAYVGAAMNGGSANHCVISNNASSSGIYVIRQTSGLTACDIYGAVLESPGAMMDCTVRGGGLSVTLAEGANAVAKGTFAMNESAPVAANVVHATNCLFTANVAESLISGLHYSGVPVQMSLVNCTVAGNRIDNTIASMEQNDGKCGVLTLVNCLFAENQNKAGTASRDFSFQYNNDDNVTLVNCLMPNGLPKDWTPVSVSALQTGNPRFCKELDPENPYALRHSSAARAKGQVSGWMAAATDIRRDTNYPRLRDGQVDIGCYQCWLDPIGFSLIFR